MVADVEAIGYITRAMTAKHGAVYPLRKDRLLVRDGRLTKPCRVYSGWSSARKLAAFIAGGCQPLDDDGSALAYYLSDRAVIYYRRDDRTSHYVPTVLRNMGTTEKNRYEIEAMGVHFNYPKPKELIVYLLSLMTDGNDIILDSFIGSGTTAHATLLLNAQDHGRRRFIGIELQDDIAKDVLYVRMNAVVSGYTAQRGQKKGKRIPGLGGGFRFCKLGTGLFDEAGDIASEVRFSDLAVHVFFTETGNPIPKRADGKTPLLGVYQGKAVYLLFNGILGDRRPAGGNVLSHDVAQDLPEHPNGNGSRVVYGEACRLGPKSLERYGIVFRQIPYELKVD